MWSCGHTNGSQELNLRMMLLDIHWIYLRSKPTLVVGVVGWAICACHNILSFIKKKKKKSDAEPYGCCFGDWDDVGSRSLFPLTFMEDCELIKAQISDVMFCTWY